MRPPNQVRDLSKLLQGKEYSAIPAFLIQGGLFAGKTTLLVHYEMDTARKALQNHLRTGRWGEVCVFLPMRGFATVWRQHRGRAAAALSAFFVDCAPGLPSLDDSVASQPAAGGLQCRLLLDALNEITASDIDERQDIMRGVCDWLSRPAHWKGGIARALNPARSLRASVFSVRERENVINLTSVMRPECRARPVHVLPWRQQDMHDYIGPRALTSDARARLIEASTKQTPRGGRRTTSQPSSLLTGTARTSGPPRKLTCGALRTLTLCLDDQSSW